MKPPRADSGPRIVSRINVLRLKDSTLKDFK